MNWRKVLLMGLLAAGLSLSLVPRASADPPPWAGKWKHHHNEAWERAHDRWHQEHNRDWYRDHRYGRYDHNDWWRTHDRDRDGDWRRWRDRSSYGWNNNGRYNDDGYRRLMERMNNDRAKINEIEPTGRHRKALQWYKDDMRNAQRDLDQYRAGR